MPAGKIKSRDYESLVSRAPEKRSGSSGDHAGLKPPQNEKSQKQSFHQSQNLKNLSPDAQAAGAPDEPEFSAAPAELVAQPVGQPPPLESAAGNTYAEQQKTQKKQKIAEKDSRLISSDRWIARNGHTMTYIGLYLFSILVLFRPYEMVPGLGFLSATAFYFAAATLLIFIPTQLSTEGSMTAFPTEVKCVLVMTLLAIVTIPIGKDAGTSWKVFNDTFIKAVLMFIVMVNVLRTRRRLMGVLWLSLSVGVVLSYMALSMYARGELKAEGYRVAVEIGGIFGNPNDLALHLVTMTPIAISLAVAARNKLMRLMYFAIAALFVAGNMVTFSRGGFIGLIVAGGVLAWKLGRRQRLAVMLVSMLAGGLAILLAPGNYGLRILSIFVPGLDPVGSSDQRKELLYRSIWVSIRNPWGIGVGNSPIMNDYNLQTHNAYTQVSSELGVLGLAAYLIFIVSPFRKLAAIERTLFAANKHDWFYYLSIGLQASIAGYMASSFFVSVAYNWFIYYLIAYAVAFRRIYRLETEGGKAEKAGQHVNSGELQTA